MKRARKGIFSFGRKKQSIKEQINDLNAYESDKSVLDDIEVDEEDKKQYQIKYFGEIFDDDSAGVPHEAALNTSVPEKEEPPQPEAEAPEIPDNTDIKETQIIPQSVPEDDSDPAPAEPKTPEYEEDISSEPAPDGSDIGGQPEASDDASDEDIKTYDISKSDAEDTPVIDDLEETKIIDTKAISKASEDEANDTDSISSSSRKRKNKGQKSKFPLVLAVSLFVILTASVLAVIISGFFDQNGPSDEDFYDNDNFIEPVNTDMGKINVLILGVDKDGLRTDTIIVASFDTGTNEVNMLSVPRDTRMYIGSKFQKINAAHAIPQKGGKIKGPQGSIEAVTRLTGIPINYYVEFSFDAFRDTIDALDGVYFNVPQNMNYDDPAQDLHIHLTQGFQLLDGDKAEQLVRFRRYPEGDIKRVRVQQDFIRTVAEQKLNAGIITKLPDLFKTLSKNVDTSFKLSDMSKYAPNLLKLDLQNISMYELPGAYSGSEYEASYWLPNMNEIKFLTESVFGYDTTYVTDGKPADGAHYGLLSTNAPDRPAPTPSAQTAAPYTGNYSTPSPSRSPSVSKRERDNDTDNNTREQSSASPAKKTSSAKSSSPAASASPAQSRPSASGAASSSSASSRPAASTASPASQNTPAPDTPAPVHEEPQSHETPSEPAAQSNDTGSDSSTSSGSDSDSGSGFTRPQAN